MPPVKKAATPPVAAPAEKKLLEVGAIVNMEIGGRTLTGLEVLDYDSYFIKFRWNVQFAPQTEIVLVPWERVGTIGLAGER